MGLDNYAARAEGEELSEEDLDAFEAAGAKLCGGLMSGAPGSFRGKVYCILIREVTGEDLHDDFIPPERVKAMYEALRDCNPEEVSFYDDRVGDPQDQVIELRKFFKVCAERRLGIESWW